MSTLPERIEWILANCSRPDGSKWSARALSQKAELAQAHVGMILRGDVGARVSSETLARIAAAAGVSADWLAHGTGGPHDAPAEASSRPIYRNLENWHGAVGEARRRWPWLRRYPTVVEASGDTSALLIAGPATPEMVYEAVTDMLARGDPDKIAAAEDARIDGEIAAAESATERALARQREMRARGETPPPLKVILKQIAAEDRRATRGKPAND